MKVVIPMSGIGRRFLEAGYKDPKPLILVDGKPMIHHVIDLFPGETEFYFICNDEHLATTSMRQVLLDKVPNAKIYSVPVTNRQGPVHAVMQIANELDDADEIIVSYCDYGTQWDYKGFLDAMHTKKADGGIPCYTGFHPHMLGTDHYAYCKHTDMVVEQIQEKKPFTENKMSEYASNGTYYFRTGALMKHAFQILMDRQLSLNNEYYVSLAMNLLIEQGLQVRIFEIEKMLQWGTPADLEEYQQWSVYFRNQSEAPLSFRGTEPYTLLLPMAGAGSRFQMVGFQTPKPLLPVEGKEMVVNAVECLPPASRNLFVCRNEHLSAYPIEQVLKDSFTNTTILGIDASTEGQACTCELGIQQFGVDPVTPLLISACDNGAYYDTKEFYKLLDDPTVDVIVWSFTNNRTSKLYPHMYAWLDVDADGTIHDVSIKKPFPDKENKHCIIGTMYFKSTGLYLKGLREIYKTNSRTNGEFYVDNLLIPLIQKGYKVKVFEVKNYLCWGTPNDYKSYQYWNEYFRSRV
jgi:NDP-sugar pyrophosphorylase family protein